MGTKPMGSEPTGAEPRTARQAAEPLLLVQRLPAGPGAEPLSHDPATACLQLPLTADQRTSLRGHRRSACGRDLLLQLPRGEALQPGDRLLSAAGSPQVLVVAAAEPVMRVSSAEPLALLQAAYHLGNRHVAMELHADQLVLLQDSVLAGLLRQRGLQVECLEAPFQPEAGAYAGLGHGHGHGHGAGHHHDHGPQP